MSTPAFTPGPWQIHNGHLIRKCEGDFCTPIADLRAPYRKQVGLARGYKEEWHNGHLIAAAPDGFELAAWITEHWANQDMNHADFRCEVARRAGAFLAKARGESPSTHQDQK